MDVTLVPLPGVLILRPQRFDDSRGYFNEGYNRRRFEAIGIDVDFVQDNLSFSRPRLTVRGLHFQKTGSLDLERLQGSIPRSRSVE